MKNKLDQRYVSKIIFSQDHNGFKAFNEEFAFHNSFNRLAHQVGSFEIKIYAQ